jgi:hypothetical protein
MYLRAQSHGLLRRDRRIARAALSLAKGDLVGYGVQHRAGRGAFKGQDVELHQVVDLVVALPNTARSQWLECRDGWPNLVDNETPSWPRKRLGWQVGTSPLRMCSSVPAIVVFIILTIASVPP